MGQPPYADFSVFGPLGHRMMKRIKLPRYNIERDGTLRTLELYGPNSLGTWLQSYNVLLAVLVMIDAVWWTLDTSKRTGRTLRGC